MKNYLWPIKLANIAYNLNQMSAVTPLWKCSGVDIGEMKDGMLRMRVCMPETRYSFGDCTGMYSLNRLAFPRDPRSPDDSPMIDLQNVVALARFEAYREAPDVVSGPPKFEPVIEPVLLTKLEGDKALAIEVELLHLLLCGKGIHIPTL